jgi:predicted CXXCH cytochrome family protein
MGDEDLEIVSENCLRCHPGASRVDERGGIAISHGEHGEKSVQCVDCHSGRFAHPGPEQVAHARAQEERRRDTRRPGHAPEEQVTMASHADCYGCHDGKRTIAGEVVFDASVEENCTRCHLDAEAVYDHGGNPWKEEDRTCLSCHDPKGEGHFSLRGKDETELCSKCHEKLHEVELVSTHEPFREGKCDECHRVMSPLHLFRDAPGPTVTFCLSCHEDTALRLAKKPAKTESHFVKGKKDLHRKHASLLDEDPRWCGTCHAGHGSPAAKGMILLRNDAGEVDEGATFEATESGGTCSGACHEEAEGYEWPGEQAAAGEGAPP